MQFTRRLVTGTLWSSAETLVRQAIGLTVFVMIARQVGAEAIGIVVLAMALISIFEAAVSDGAVERLVQRQEIEPLHLDSAFWAVTALSLLLAATLIAIAPLFARLFDVAELSSVLQALAFYLPLTALAAVPTARLKRDLRFRPFALRALLSLAAGGGIGLWLAFDGQGVWALVAMHLTTAFTVLLCMWIAAGWRPSFRLSLRHLRDLAGYGVYSTGSRLVIIADQRIAPFAIGLFLGVAEVGFFAMARRVLEMLIQLLLAPVNQVALPAFARLQTDGSRIKALLHFLERAIALTSFPALLGLAAIAPLAVELVLGPDWLPMVLALQILCLAGLPMAIEFNTPVLARALGRPDLVLYQALIFFGAGVILLPLAATESITLVAVAMLARQLFLVWPLRVLLVRHLTGQGFLVRYLPLAGILCCAAAMAGAVLFALAWAPVHASVLQLTAAAISVGALAFVAFLLLFARDRVIGLFQEARQRLSATQATAASIGSRK